ncbi:hypothetical protein JCM9533A_36480 [Catenuloplanes niger JCM 9533]
MDAARALSHICRASATARAARSHSNSSGPRPWVDVQMFGVGVSTSVIAGSVQPAGYSVHNAAVILCRSPFAGRGLIAFTRSARVNTKVGCHALRPAFRRFGATRDAPVGADGSVLRPGESG